MEGDCENCASGRTGSRTVRTKVYCDGLSVGLGYTGYDAKVYTGVGKFGTDVVVYT